MGPTIRPPSLRMRMEPADHADEPRSSQTAACQSFGKPPTSLMDGQKALFYFFKMIVLGYGA